MRSATTGTVAVRPATLLRTGVLTLAAALTGVLLAVPALAAPETSEPPSTSSSAAVVDPARPTARLVHGPNCTDGYVRVEVTNGTAGRTVTLQYDGADVGRSVTLGPGEQTVLEGPEVAGGAQVDVQVAVSSTDGAGAPIPLGTSTRPAQQDCDAVGEPQPTSPAPTTPPTTTPAPSSTPAPPPASTSAPTTAPTTPPTTSRPPTTTPAPTTAPAPSPGTTTAPPASSSAAAPPGGTASAGQVSPGSVVTIRGTGFAPGEQVTVTLVGTGVPLATVTADDEGRVEAVVQIPQDVVLGPAVVQLVGEESAAATQVALDVAARERPAAVAGTPWPLVAAGLALLAVAAALVAATRRPRSDDWPAPAGPARDG
ncbi:hypothetical protein SAMN03159343_0840 [Klenkia marina]|uniref:IPT/TIG domain-containing protein n=1 Tax=Klenkia marina TaxID=1960309 RepID=A0A1G4XFN2_9ACTN|nr:hypothetical protein [Klenkia marina]SCX39946.1 hypothetical protein SAMN03159343_0840 [Klenkia marina]